MDNFCSETILMLEIQQLNVLLLIIKGRKIKKEMDIIEILTVLLPCFIMLNCINWIILGDWNLFFIHV